MEYYQLDSTSKVPIDKDRQLINALEGVIKSYNIRNGFKNSEDEILKNFGFFLELGIFNAGAISTEREIDRGTVSLDEGYKTLERLRQKGEEIKWNLPGVDELIDEKLKGLKTYLDNYEEGKEYNP